MEYKLFVLADTRLGISSFISCFAREGTRRGRPGRRLGKNMPVACFLGRGRVHRRKTASRRGVGFLLLYIEEEGFCPLLFFVPEGTRRGRPLHGRSKDDAIGDVSRLGRCRKLPKRGRLTGEILHHPKMQGFLQKLVGLLANILEDKQKTPENESLFL